jgi:hypothetical protein
MRRRQEDLCRNLCFIASELIPGLRRGHLLSSESLPAISEDSLGRTKKIRSLRLMRSEGKKLVILSAKERYPHRGAYV